MAKYEQVGGGILTAAAHPPFPPSLDHGGGGLAVVFWTWLNRGTVFRGVLSVSMASFCLATVGGLLFPA